jgi:ParB family chromosome partitioning protein
MNPIRLPCADIHPGPDSRGYRSEEVEPLADSIRTHGVLRPILVRESSDGYVIVHGERRWRAARALGHATITAFLVIDLLHKSGAVF